jgi:hypothetical protein
VHLQISYEGVPVGHGAPASPCRQVYADQPKGRRDERRRTLSIRAKAFSVEQQFGIKFPRTPSSEYCTNRRFGNSKKCRYHTEIGRQIDNGTDVKILVSPPIKAVANAGGE